MKLSNVLVLSIVSTILLGGCEIGHETHAPPWVSGGDELAVSPTPVVTAALVLDPSQEFIVEGFLEHRVSSSTCPHLQTGDIEYRFAVLTYLDGYLEVVPEGYPTMTGGYGYVPGSASGAAVFEGQVQIEVPVYTPEPELFDCLAGGTAEVGSHRTTGSLEEEMTAADGRSCKVISSYRLTYDRISQ